MASKRARGDDATASPKISKLFHKISRMSTKKPIILHLCNVYFQVFKEFDKNCPFHKDVPKKATGGK